jgi:ribonuclease T1
LRVSRSVLTRWLLAAALSFIPFAHAQKAPAPATHPEVGEIAWLDLPKEARETIALIRKAGPYPYAKDGAVFGNREAMLPRQNRGYYREYTVKTPGQRGRGARRIIWGKSGEFYYTEDHYNHFRRVRE